MLPSERTLLVGDLLPIFLSLNFGTGINSQDRITTNELRRINDDTTFFSHCPRRFVLLSRSRSRYDSV